MAREKESRRPEKKWIVSFQGISPFRVCYAWGGGKDGRGRSKRKDRKRSPSRERGTGGDNSGKDAHGGGQNQHNQTGPALQKNRKALRERSRGGAPYLQKDDGPPRGCWADGEAV